MASEEEKRRRREAENEARVQAYLESLGEDERAALEHDALKQSPFFQAQLRRDPASETVAILKKSCIEQFVLKVLDKKAGQELSMRTGCGTRGSLL